MSQLKVSFETMSNFISIIEKHKDKITLLKKKLLSFRRLLFKYNECHNITDSMQNKIAFDNKGS